MPGEHKAVLQSLGGDGMDLWVAVDHAGKIHLFALQLCPALLISDSDIGCANAGARILKARYRWYTTGIANRTFNGSSLEIL